MHDVFVVNGYYRDHPGQRHEFGGLWLKSGSPRRLVVMVTADPSARPYAWEKDIANPDQLRFRTVEFSYAYLRSTQTKVTHTAEQTQEHWAKRICGVGVDVRRNVVEITSYTGWAPVGFWDHWEGLVPRRVFDFSQGCPNEGTALAVPGGPDLNHDVGVVRGYYADHPELRDQFASLYFVQGQPDTLHVMIVDDPLQRPYAWEADIANPDQLRVHKARYSFRYLNRIQTKIERAMRADQPYVRGVMELWVNVKTNHLELGTRSGWAPPGFWDHYEGRFDRAAVHLSKSGGSRPDA